MKKATVRRLQVAVSIFVLIFTVTRHLQPVTSSAHVLKTDGNIGAVLHVDPDDDPIAGSQTSFFFEFKDKDNKFTPQNCNCLFSITEDGKEIFSHPLFQDTTSPSLESASIFFTFPEKNVYQVKVSGTPTTPGAFQKFSLIYDIRVDRDSTGTAQNSQSSSQTSWFSTHLVHLIGAGIVGLFLIFALIKQSLSKSDKQAMKPKI